ASESTHTVRRKTKISMSICVAHTIRGLSLGLLVSACATSRATTANAPASAADRRALLLDPSNPEWRKPAPPVSRLRFETTKGVFVLELVRAQGPIGA